MESEAPSGVTSALIDPYLKVHVRIDGHQITCTKKESTLDTGNSPSISKEQRAVLMHTPTLVLHSPFQLDYHLLSRQVVQKRLGVHWYSLREQ